MMLTPTTSTIAMRFCLAGHGAQGAFVAASFAKTAKGSGSPAAMIPRKCFQVQSPSRQLSVMTSSVSRVAFRQRPTNPTSSVLSRVAVRSASTAPSASSGAGAAAASEGGERLDWNSFFQLRKTRRRWQLAFSIAMLGASATAGGAVLTTGVMDPVVSQVPLDPFVTFGLMVMGFAAMGWLLGPSMGSAVFNTINRRWKKQMTLKETEFFARVKKNRVDPSSSGTSNPVPDFYGENISSVSGYRQWLKDQRAFNKKRTRFL